MEKYNSALEEMKNDFDGKNDNKLFWKHTRENEECSELTVGQDLSVSIMTIFEIESIEMKEGFIYW